MIEAGSLQVISELAVAMVGMSGLVAVFVSKGGMLATDRIRFVMIVISGVGLAVLAYVPSWVSHYATDKTPYGVSPAAFT